MQAVKPVNQFYQFSIIQKGFKSVKYHKQPPTAISGQDACPTNLFCATIELLAP